LGSLKQGESVIEATCNQAVYLTKDFEELALYRGTVGIVRSTWNYPNAAYEVEFKTGGTAMRLLLLQGQVLPCDLPSRN
jgi:hypothetical protein